MNKNVVTELDAVESLAHDLKAPLAVARSWVDIMQHAGPLNTDQSEALDKALQSLDRATDMIVNMLALTHPNDDLKLVPLDLGAALRQCVELLQPQAVERGIDVYCHLPHLPVIIQADESLMRRLLDNLLHNAIKFNHEGGTVEASVSYQGAFVRVDVQDDGPGVPADEQPLIFDRFYRGVKHRRARNRGSGMGLAICKTIVEQHGGSIWLESAPGQGSCFSFKLPIRPDHAPQRRSALDLMRGDEASESADGVDDDHQESAENPDAESRHDEV